MSLARQRDRIYDLIVLSFVLHRTSILFAFPFHFVEEQTFSSNKMTSFTDLAEEYIRWDPNPETRSQIQALLHENKEVELKNLLTKRIQFGTAGLRAAMGPGYACMNDLVVLQTCQGLIRYLESVDPAAKEKGLVVGYDHRRLGTLSSQGFARITAAVFLSQGFKVYLLENFVATPFVPFAIKHFKTAGNSHLSFPIYSQYSQYFLFIAGIMVTASHNPKQDNGYKVYWGNGAQIIPPHDANISHFIQQNLQPWQTYDTEGIFEHYLAKNVTEEVADAYIRAITNMSTRKSLNNSSPLRVAYTGNKYPRELNCQFLTFSSS